MSLSGDDAFIIDPAVRIKRLETDAPNPENEPEEEAGLPEDVIFAMPDPLGRVRVEPRIGGDKPFLQTMVEGILVMFWDGEYRERWMQENNIPQDDPVEAIYAQRSRIQIGPNATPIPEGSALTSAPTRHDTPYILDTYANADRIYGNALVAASQAMHSEFRASSAETLATKAATAPIPVNAPVPA